MKPINDKIYLALKSLGLLVGASFLVIAFIKIVAIGAMSPTEKAIQRKLAKENENLQKLTFDLVDPELSPKEIHKAVIQGYHIFIDTQKNAAAYVGNKLNCTNCHFSGGNTTGGENGSISLAAIAAAYPQYNERSKKVITLSERINSCFMRSLNGKPLKLGSDEMSSLESYLHWISKDFPIYAPIPWRGLKPITLSSAPDPKRGQEIYERNCALCHGKNGEGGENIPPVFGNGSFNDGAGMSNLETLAAFIHANMPYENPSLTEEEAADAAAFILKQTRPHYEE